MASTISSGSRLVKQAEQSMLEDIRLRMSLLSNPDWRRQMQESHDFFTQPGAEGASLSDLGRE